MPSNFANTPPPPYFAVIFTSQRSSEDHGYAEMAEKMQALALRQPGCIGLETARNPDGFGVTVSYFSDEGSIHAWKKDAEHLHAQRLGKDLWYARYQVKIAKVERAYGGP